MPQPIPSCLVRLAAASSVAALSLAVTLPAAQAQSLTIPGTTQTYTSSYPFGGSDRLQLVYGSSLFTGITGPVKITSISFVGSLVSPSTTSQSGILSLYVGTTSVSPGSISATYATNLSAATTTTEFSSSAQVLSANGLGTAVTINLPIPVTYNPTSGQSLFVDVAGSYSFFTSSAWANTGGQSFARLYGNPNTAATGTADTSRINIVTIGYTSAPEPASAALAAFPLLGLAGAAVRRRRAA